MLAVVSWKCDCGTHVKVMYDTDGKTRVRCPTCPKIHAVDGKISHLWVSSGNDDTKWTEQDASPLIVQ